MWGRIRALMKKELLAVLRDPRSRLMLIGPPLMQLFIFSFAATLEVSNARIGVLDHDAGRWSAELVQQIAASPSFAEVVPLQSVAHMREAIDTQSVIAAVHIAPSFSRDIESGQPGDLQVLLDGRRSNAAQIVSGYVSNIVAGLGAYETRPPAARTVERSWFNENLKYQWFTVPSLIGIIAMMSSLTVTVLSVARERELGTYDQLMVSPLRVSEILLGKTLPPLIIGMAQATVFVLATIFVFRVPLVGSLGLLYLALVFYLAAVIGVGLFISSLAMTQQQAFLGAFVFALPAMILSGFATPIENMPDWLQVVTYANPLRYILIIVKGVFLKGLPADEVLAQVAPLIVIAAVTLSAAAYTFRARIE